MYKLPFLAVILTALVAVSPAAAHPRVDTLKLPAEFALPNDVVTGPDGAVWATDSSLGRIWRVGKHTTVRSYELGQQPAGITTAHGSMWVAWISEHSSGVVSRMTFKGRFTNRYKIARGFNDTLAFGRDGSLWIAQGSLGQLARLDVGRHR